MTTIVGEENIRRMGWMSLRSEVQLHLTVPAFNRSRVLAKCRMAGFKGKTLRQARAWIDIECDRVGLTRQQGLPKKENV